MKLSTGKVAFPIEFDNGDKAVIYFNPNDRGIQERIQNFENTIEKRIKEIDFEKYKQMLNDGSNINIDIDNIEAILDMPTDDLKLLRKKLDVGIEIAEQYNDIVKSELDRVFDSKISDVVFRYCEPFDTILTQDDDGSEKSEVYIKQFVRWLMVEMKKYAEKSNSAMDKHISKYVK